MTSPTLSLSTSLRGTDLLVVGIAQGPDGPLVAQAATLTEEQVTALTSAAAAIGASGKADEVLRLPGEPYGLPPIMSTGLGDQRRLVPGGDPSPGGRRRLARCCVQVRCRGPAHAGRREPRGGGRPRCGHRGLPVPGQARRRDPTPHPHEADCHRGEHQGSQAGGQPRPGGRRGHPPDPPPGGHASGRAASGRPRSRGRSSGRGHRHRHPGPRREGPAQAEVRRHPGGGTGFGEPTAPGAAVLLTDRGKRPPRSGRQGHHVRLGWAVVEATGRDDHDEVRHGGSGCGARGRARHRPAGHPPAGDRLPGHRGEHAQRCRPAPGRRHHGVRRQDRRGAQHRCRGAPGDDGRAGPLRGR